MSWLDKLFGINNGDATPGIILPESNPESKDLSVDPPTYYAWLKGLHFGRYSDNNKSYAKMQRWNEAEDLFRKKAYEESFAAFFDFLRDEEEDNVTFHADGNKFTFEFPQGSKCVYGECDGTRIVAHAALAIMEKPGTAVMRRLLDLNFSLMYSRCALSERNTLCMVFDTDVETASPNKLYYGLKELATRADRHDDMLLVDFPSLKPTGTAHIRQLQEDELEVRYLFFQKWIQDTLDLAGSLNQDSFSGAIAHLFLTLLYRIDFLIMPEGKLLNDLEQIVATYWEKKEEVALVERNQKIKEGVHKLLSLSKENFAGYVYRTKGTFALAARANMDKVRENINGANKDARWYADNKHPELAPILNEYGIVYSQSTIGIPGVLTDLFIIYMAVMQADYFAALGFQPGFYDPGAKQFDRNEIMTAVDQIISRYKDRYYHLSWNHDHVKYDSPYDFGMSFTEELAGLNMETKR